MPPTQYIISGKVAPPPNSRDALFSLLQGADPLDPKAPQGPHPHPTPQGPLGTPQRGPREPKGPQGDQGRLRRPRDPGEPKGPQGTPGTKGPFGGYSDAIPNGKPFREESYFKWIPPLKFLPNNSLDVAGAPQGSHNDTLRAFWLLAALLTTPYEHFGSKCPFKRHLTAILAPTTF